MTGGAGVDRRGTAPLDILRHVRRGVQMPYPLRVFTRIVAFVGPEGAALPHAA